MRRFSPGFVLGAVAFALGCSKSPHPAQQTSAAKPLPSELFGGLEPAPTLPKGAVLPEQKSDAPAAVPPATPAPSTVESTGVASAEPPQPSASRSAVDGVPRIAATALATLIYREPRRSSDRLGYLRLGGSVEGTIAHVPRSDCKGPWYAIKPRGYVCGEEATDNLDDPLVRAAAKRPDLKSPLPYPYGFVRATAPQYLRVPTRAEQEQSEIKLDEHLAWFQENEPNVQRVTLGANDIVLTDKGSAADGASMPAGFLLSTQKDGTQLLGGQPGDGQIPFWLVNGRQIPNVSGYDAPAYAVFADRVRRKTGLSFVDAFVAESDGLRRRFGVTVDLRLIPATKVKPDTASPFHGIELGPDAALPFAFVLKHDVQSWKLIKGRDEAKPVDPIPRRAIVPLSGKLRFKAGSRFYQVARDPKSWLRADDIGVVSLPPDWPEAALKGEKWIDVSLVQQTLVLYEGKRPVYATLVSTGQDRLGDPKTQKATPRGLFHIRSKHIAATMDSNENSSVAGGQKTDRRIEVDTDAKATIERLSKAEAGGKNLSEDDRRRLANIKKGRHPEYGITKRRGSSDFELRDVPWIQYFASGYALHGAYWHDVFGIPRSHGCINLAPIDARYVFMWTDPPLPTGWHGFNTGGEMGEGTTVQVRE